MTPEESERRIQELEAALQPFAMAIAYVVSSMVDAREIRIAFHAPPQSILETVDALPTVATVGDVRRAAKLLGIERHSTPPKSP
jgi:hypothetical protein